MKRSYTAWFFALALVLGLFAPASALADPGDSLDEPFSITLQNGRAETLDVAGRYYELTGSTNEPVKVTASCTVILAGVTINANTKIAPALEIASGATVTVILQANNILQGGGNSAGLQIADDAALILKGPGALSAAGGLSGAGIGGGFDGVNTGGTGGSITITDGAQVIAMGNGGAGIGGGFGASADKIAITGGAQVDATGNFASAGVGGGYFGDGGTILIDGATVEAKGSDWDINNSWQGGAGIGGGAGGQGGKITITGGADVIAISGNYAAGIGGGFCFDNNNLFAGNGGEICIDGKADVNAAGKAGGAGIGGSYLGDSGTVVIDGATVTAVSTDMGGVGGGAGLGGGAGGSGESTTITNGASVNATGNIGGAGIGGGDSGSGGTIRIDASTVHAVGDLGGAGIGGGCSGAGGSVWIGANAQVTAAGGDGSDPGDGGGAGIGGGGGYSSGTSPENRNGGAAGRIEIDATAIIVATGGNGANGTAIAPAGGGGAGIGGGGAGAHNNGVTYTSGVAGSADESGIFLPAAWVIAPTIEGGEGGAEAAGTTAQGGATVGFGGAVTGQFTAGVPAAEFIYSFYPSWPIVPLIGGHSYGGGLAAGGITYYPAPSSAIFTGSGDLCFTVSADRRNFIAAYVDGAKLVEGVDCDVASGSTIVTLRESFLNMLSSGEHKLRLVFAGGEGYAAITVGVQYVPEELMLDPPKTGGAAGLGGYALLLFALGLMQCLRAWRSRKE